ncbi:MAG: glutamate racemase [Verrucomicrobiota bacterium]|jgi:glutamate racemase|nr:glutamate racemase [Verrucomicrobiota bacterium]
MTRANTEHTPHSRTPVLFFDSGAGGLPYFTAFHKRNPYEYAVYTADRANFPYGEKSKGEITDILMRTAGALIGRFEPKAAVLACNTASVSALAALREAFPAIPWVGTVPAVKPAVMGSRTRRVGVIGTERTIEDPYIAELATKYAPDAEIIGVAAPDVVRFAEAGGESAPFDEQRRALLPSIARFREAGVDALVLGCTHFLLVLDAFRAVCAPDIAVYDSVEGVVRRIENVSLASAAPLSAVDGGAGGDQPLLLLTGDAPPGDVWLARAAAAGLIPRLFNEVLP